MKLIFLILGVFFTVNASANVSSVGPTGCNLNKHEIVSQVIDTAAKVPGPLGFAAHVDEDHVLRVLNGLEIWTVRFSSPNHLPLDVTVTDCTDTSLIPIDPNEIKSCSFLDHNTISAGTLCRTSEDAVLKLYSKNPKGEVWVLPNGDMWAASPIQALHGRSLDVFDTCKAFNSDQLRFGRPYSDSLLIGLKQFGVDEALPSLKSSLFWLGGFDLYDFHQGRVVDGFFASEADIICYRYRNQI